ncbi:MAG: TIR domain-containing protein [Candidatus Aminicenantes bacterium]|nr:TIR domain-containing protein [Candidatus Aminicenantes bacterium]
MIFTFYSYKGGVGRSMALANTAELFYRSGKKVLIVDWDLEAPGIERYFFKNSNSVIDTPGLMDILLSYKEKMSKELDENQPLEFEPISKFIIDIYPKSQFEGKLFLIHAGKRSGDHFSKYAREVLNFDWGDFYENWEGELFFEWLRDQFESIADIVLIDSRTGVTEMTGICTYQMAGTVIMFCAPNQQNIDGTYDMVMNFSSPMLTRLRPDRPLNILIVPSRVEDRSEVELLNAFRSQFIDKFNKILLMKPVKGLGSYWDLKIPYFSYYSFNETLAVNEESQSYSEDIQGAFIKLAYIMAKIQGEEPYDFNSLIKMRKSAQDTIPAIPQNIRSAGLSSNWEEDDWDILIHSIREKKCILMLGPDTSTELVGGQPRQLSEILSNQLAQKLEPRIREAIDFSDFDQVARYYSKERGYYALEAAVCSFYSQRRGMYSYLHRDIAALPFYLTISTALDNMFLEALKKENKNPISERYNFRSINPKTINMGTIENPLLFYLYGNIEDTDSLVLTEDDMTDFLLSIAVRNRLPDRLVNELKDPAKCFLFLGFGFKHWYLRILLHILGIKNKFSPSFALEAFTTDNMAEFKRTILFFRDEPYKIHFIEKGFAEFAAELRHRFDASTATPVIPIREEKRPRVFICYALEDKTFAASLYEQLKAAGLEPWLDKENLRGGDRWDEVIPRVIRKEIDYFLVLQSKSLCKKSNRYLFKEIMLARERYKEFRLGTRFIIPLKIDDGEILEELEDLQTITIDTQDKVVELIRLIQRDCKKRGY